MEEGMVKNVKVFGVFDRVVGHEGIEEEQGGNDDNG
jgi:hypothetical protein